MLTLHYTFILWAQSQYCIHFTLTNECHANEMGKKRKNHTNNRQWQMVVSLATN